MSKVCCPEKVEVKPNMFFWRGTYYSGLVCPEHNSLWDNPADSFWEGIRKSNEANPPTKTNKSRSFFLMINKEMLKI